MIASMTGFARRETSGPWGTLVCELRSVNHRFLEASFRLPDELRGAEGELRSRLMRQLRRGKVDCTITWRRPQAAGGALEIDAQALERVLAAVHVVMRALREPGAAVSALEVLRWPGVLREDGAMGEQLLAAVGEVFAATLTELVAELTASIDHERLEQELALLLQRLDVDEELERLTGHIAEVRRVIGGGEPAGRRLDFLMQELNREANTLSSKSQDLEATRSAVDM